MGFKTFVTIAKVHKSQVELNLWDSTLQEDYERLRPLAYSEAHACFICFAIDSPDSLDSVQKKWIVEVKHFLLGSPIFLLGCKKDLRDDPQTIEKLWNKGQRPVTPKLAEEVRQKIGAAAYFETSAKTGEGVERALEDAAKCVLRRVRRPYRIRFFLIF